MLVPSPMFINLASLAYLATAADPTGDCSARLTKLNLARPIQVSQLNSPEIHLLGARMKLLAAGISGADLARHATVVEATTDPKIFRSHYRIGNGRSITIYYLGDATRVGHVIEAGGRHKSACGAGF